MKAPAPGGNPGRAVERSDRPRSTAPTSNNPVLVRRPKPPALSKGMSHEEFEDFFERYQQAQEERHAIRGTGR